MILSIAITVNALLCAGLLLSWLWALVRPPKLRRDDVVPDFVPVGWRPEERLRPERELVDLPARPGEREPAGR